jgi:hypothetical protein
MPLEKPAPGLEIIPAPKPVSSLKKIKGISLKCDPVKFLLEDRTRKVTKLLLLEMSEHV